MSPTRVGVIGAGVAGPVIAMLLKQQGYDPVVYERLDALSDAGLGLGLQPNGMAVLARIPGLIEHIDGHRVDEFHFYSVLPEDHGLLGVSDHPRRLRAIKGIGAVSVQRPLLHRRLVEFARKLDVPVHFGHKLEALEQDDESVTVSFANGVKETFSFVVGCDGIHSNTRGCLFGETPADYTGLSQWGGLSPTPEFWKGKHAPADIYGNGAHMIVVPMSESLMIWAVSVREPESKEEWRSTDAAVSADFKANSPFARWGFGAGELVRNSLRIVRYGIYDRPELPTWHKGRVVLVGDAAHPTSPHLGMGANQSYEDVGLLADLLAAHNPGGAPPATATLEEVFAELERVRLPRTAELVRQARAQGDTRVVSGVEACIARNNYYRDVCNDPAKLRARFGIVDLEK
ncbi:FAD-dependent monooxygenase [Phanerochaete sordida]|uniref:FAD-dependent monooxygenase n=1 Tax=Phanerochaete sordida TaxID=48140 RepID=A0A9P3GHC4_9APHY|nr:FAD-dependent monooxygenase [Phanerochaete sordida]